MQQFTPLEYIKIDIANQYGKDKEDWKDRLEFADDVIAGNIKEPAENPILAQKALRAFADAYNGRPTGFVMGLDATASGIQIMAALMNCEKSAEAVNVVNTGHRRDVYTEVGNTMGVTRSTIKKPLMTYFYGSTAQPKAIFGDQVAMFHRAMKETLPGAVECMEDMQSCWQSRNLAHTWHLPDGHTAHVKVMAPNDYDIRIEELGGTEFVHRIYENQPQITGRSLAANIIHSIDGYIVREMYRRADAQGFDLLSIHDCFWASPNYIQNVRQNYLDILIEINQMNLLKTILEEVTQNRNLGFTRYRKNLSRQMQHAEYALS